MNNNKPDVDQVIKTVLIIHWTLFAMVFVYGGLAFFLSRIRDKTLKDPSVFHLVGIILGIISFSMIVSVLFIRKFWLSPESLADVGENEVPQEKYQQTMILQGALLEAIPIYGLLMSMLLDWFLIFIPFAIPSLVLMIVFRPSKMDFERRLDRAGFSSSSKDETKTGL